MKVELTFEYDASVLAELDERQPTPDSIKSYLLEVLRDRRDGPAGLEPLGQAILALEGLE
jgi:hypothetical protein